MAEPVAQSPKTETAPVKAPVVTREDKGPKEDAFDIHLVDLSDPEKIIEHQLKTLREEADKRDDTDGPADNVSGDNSDSFEDHVFSQDPYKKAFPPGPDDISKLGNE